MIKFKNIKTNKIKTAFSYREDEEKIYIKFSPESKEYGYCKSNIEITNFDNNQFPFTVYSLVHNVINAISLRKF